MSNVFNKFLWSKSFDISEFTPEEKHFIKLREPNTAEFKVLCKCQKQLVNENEEDVEEILDIVDTFCGLTATLIIDHDFYDNESGENKKCSSKEVSEFIKSKITLAKFILGEYMHSVPLGQTNSRK